MVNLNLDHFYNNLFQEELLLKKLCSLNIRENTTEYEKVRDQIIEKSININWRKFIKLVQINRLQTVILETLESYKFTELLPLKIQRELVKLSFSTRLYCSDHLSETKKILKAFNKESISFVVMKTYALSDSLFGVGRYKTSIDIDILVPVDEFKKAAFILLRSGYKYFEKHSSLSGLSKLPYGDFFLPKNQEIFKKANHDVELHTTIVDTFYFLPKPILSERDNRKATDELCKSAEYVSFQGLKVRAFAPTQLFLSLFLHSFFQHNLQFAITYYECAVIILKFDKNLDWNWIFDFVKRYELKPYFLWFLCIFNDLYPGMLPKKIALKVNKYQGSFGTKHKVAFFYTKCKVFHPTNFLKDPLKEREKEWLWAIINNNLTKVFFLKLRRRILPFYA